MIGTYASAALICAASMLVGRAILGLAGGGESRHWLAPAVGFGAVITVTGFLARAPGHATSAALGTIALIAAAALVLWRRPGRAGASIRLGLLVAVLVALVLSIPFAISGRWGLLGVGFNNDLGLHLAWAEWLRSGLGPMPEAGYPLGPHALADTVTVLPGIGLGQAFVGEILAIGILTALTALVALGDLRPGRRVAAATLVAITYLGASYYAQGTFKETAEALFVLAFAVYLFDLYRQRAEIREQEADFGPSAGWRWVLVPLALAGGIFFSYSFAGLAWPVAILAFWAATVPEIRAGLRPARLARTLLRPKPLLAIVVLGGLTATLMLVGPFAFVHGFNRVAGTNTYGPVSPLEALGVWPSSNYRLSAAGGAHLTGLAGAIGVLAVVLGSAWWLRRREFAVPVALAACAVLYLAALATSGEYSQAKALMIAAPLAMLVAIRPLLFELHSRRGRHFSRKAAEMATAVGGEPAAADAWRLGWAVLAVAFVAGAVYSSLLVLRDTPVGPPGHGAELRAFMPALRGEPVLYAGQDRYAAYELMGADTHVPLVEFPDADVSASPEKPFDTGDAYSPIDFDSFSRATLARFPYVITGRAAWNSEAPRGFKRVAATPSYLLWQRVGPLPRDRHVLLEGTEPAAHADCAAPELQILIANPGRASLFGGAAVGGKGRWSPGADLETGESASQTLALPAGDWLLSLQYFSPFGLTLSAPGLRQPLKAAQDGQRPTTISLASNGQFWPAGEIHSDGEPIRFTVTADDPSTLQRLTGYSGKAVLGELAAVKDEPRRLVPLNQSCSGWVDWYEAEEAP
jgi:Ca2+/Na+ antiporter